jgi:hypothetical protein
MWEAVAAAGRRDDLARWALATFPGADVYVSADDRVVVVTDDEAPPPDPPVGLVARAPHAWPFERFGPA